MGCCQLLPLARSGVKVRQTMESDVKSEIVENNNNSNNTTNENSVLKQEEVYTLVFFKKSITRLC